MRQRTGKPPRVWPFGVAIALAAGVYLGTFLVQPAPPAAVAAQSPPAEAPPASVPAPRPDVLEVEEAVSLEAQDVRDLALVPDTALGEDGGAFVPLGTGGAVPETMLAAAPDVVVVEDAVASRPAPPAADASAPEEPAALPALPREAPTPVRRLSARDARAVPLLVRRRGAKRIFYETSAIAPKVGPLPGEWAAVGRCADRFQMRFEQPLRQMGGVRGVGSGSGDAEWAVAVPAQGCQGASWKAARASAGEGAAATVVEEGALRVEAGADRMAVLSGGVVIWSLDAAPGASVRLLGVYRRAGRREAYFVETGPRAALLRLVTAREEGAGWTAEVARPAGG